MVELGYSRQHVTQAFGWLSAELAARADAWNGNAPDWFPDPPEWLELEEAALAATHANAEEERRAFNAAILAGERAHLPDRRVAAPRAVPARHARTA